MRWSEMTERDRDALVAEKVMGWTRHYPSIAWEGCDHWWVRPGETDPHRGIGKLPDYTTDIAAAWRVMERMRGLGFYVILEGDPSDGRWTCTMGRNEDPIDTTEVDMDTAPEAICLAALWTQPGGLDVED